MAARLLEIGLTNVALALVLSVVVVLVTRWKSNAHLASILWLIVLFKFVTPPLLPLSITINSNEPAVKSVDLPRAAADQNVPRPHPDSWAATSFGPQKSAAQPTGESHPIAGQTARVEIEATSPAASTAAVREKLFFLWNEVRGVWSLDTLWLIWLAGSLIATSLFLFNGMRFNRIVRLSTSTDASDPLHQLLFRLGDQLGLRRSPNLAVVDAEISPLVWMWMGRTTVVLPARLARELSAEQLEMVLCHELAHIRRRDHWFRWLEAVVQCLYWWFVPLIWIRRQLHAAQEECCDAFVDRCYPERRVEYCETLFNAAVRLTNARRAPLVASEFGRVHSLKSRIQVLLQSRLSKPLSKPVFVGCLLCGALVSALSVSWVAADDKKDADKPTTVIRVTGGDGGPILQGQVEINGRTEKDKYFQQKAGIRRGSANFYFDSTRVREMTVKLSAPSHMAYYKKFIPQKPEESFAIEPEYKFPLKSGIKIGGSILNEAAKPIEGAEVYIYFPTNRPIEEGFDSVETTVKTDAKGKWELDGVPDDLSKMTCRIRHKSHVSSKTIEEIRPEHHAGLKAFADVRKLADAPTFTCTVVDPEGKPVKDAMLLMRGTNLYEDYGRGDISKTDVKGEVQLSKVSVGALEFALFHPDWALNGVSVRSPQTEPMTITMRKGKRVEFVCTDTNGKPIADVGFYPQAPDIAEVPPGQETIFLSTLDFLCHRDLLAHTSDENGSFVWENAPNMKLGYQIISREYLSQPGGEYGPDGSPHKLVFRKNIPVTASVVEAAGGKPVEDFKILQGTHFKENRPGHWQWSSDRRDGVSGKFETKLRTLDRIIRFRVQAKGYRPRISQELDAAALPDKPIALLFRLGADKGYAGTALTPDGKPAAGAKIYTKSKNESAGYDVLRVVNGVVDESTATTKTVADAAGKFEIATQKEPFICLILHESGYQKLIDVELFERSELKLQPWASVSGSLSINGVPAANIAINMRNYDSIMGSESDIPTADVSYNLRTDAAGKYDFSKCTAGEWDQVIGYDESISSPIYRQRAYEYRRQLRLEPGQQIVEPIGKEGADVVGRVMLPKDPKITVTENRVYVWENVDFEKIVPPSRRGRSHHTAFLQSDGSFRIYNLAPATHEMEISITLSGEDFPRPGYTKKIVITPEMFVGKSATNPIDLGELEVEAMK